MWRVFLLFPNWEEIRFLCLIQWIVGKRDTGFSFLKWTTIISVFIIIRDYSHMNYLGFLYKINLTPISKYVIIKTAQLVFYHIY